MRFWRNANLAQTGCNRVYADPVRVRALYAASTGTNSPGPLCAPWAGRLLYAEIGNCFVDLRHTREKAASQAVTAFLKRFRQLGRLQRR